MPDTEGNACVVEVEDALMRLHLGNLSYLDAVYNDGDISPELRFDTAEHGQHPFATIVTCADSRVVPEHVFMTGLGTLFCVRVAGNAIGQSQLGSIEYAAGHLGTRLIVIMGHTHCGAIEAAMAGPGEGAIADMLAPIREAIGDERDDYIACRLNVDAAVERVRADPPIVKLIAEQGFRVVGAIYHIDTGAVEISA